MTTTNQQKLVDAARAVGVGWECIASSASAPADVRARLLASARHEADAFEANVLAVATDQRSVLLEELALVARRARRCQLVVAFARGHAFFFSAAYTVPLEREA